MAYNPPPGPPPSQREHAPPPGPPPSRANYDPPAGPPPAYTAKRQDGVPNEDWKVIPDTALLPPPPSVGHVFGSSSDAEFSESNRADDWCRTNPLIPPHHPSPAQRQSVQRGDIRVMKPPEYGGDLMMPSTGTWRGSTRAGAPDSCLITSAPLYFALADSPSRSGHAKTIYFEVEIRSLGRGRRNEECAVAIGFCAVPYPTWRLPGWQRGSIGVHSDDGRRYVNDTFGGKDFTSPMNTGDTIGLGITFTASTSVSNYPAGSSQNTSLDAEVFFTRNGQKDGGWNLHEELDAKTDRGIDGLEGTFDLYAAVGVYGGAEFDIKLKRDTWLWLPRQ